MRIYKSFPPVEKTEITDIQDALGVTLPDEYVEFLLTKHAYTIFANWLKVDEGDLYFLNFFHYHNKEEIHFGEANLVNFNKLNMQSYEGYLAIARGYAYDAYLIKLTQPNLGHIYYLKLGNTMEEGSLLIAKSFNKFCEILVDNENYMGKEARYKNIILNPEKQIATDNHNNKSTEKSIYILFHGYYANHPVRLIGGTYEEANDIAVQYEYNSIVKSGMIGIYAMEPNTLLSHIDLAKYLELTLDTKVTYIREDEGRPQILWDYPKPRNLKPENVKDIIEITKFRTYDLVNVDQFSEGEFIILFADEMGFSIEGISIDAFVHDDYASAEIEALKLILMSCTNHIAKIDEFKTRTEEFPKLIENLKYFRFNPGYCVFEANVEIHDVGTYNEKEIEALKKEVKDIWAAIGKETYVIEQL